MESTHNPGGQPTPDELMERWQALAPRVNALAASAKVLSGATQRLARSEGYEALNKVQRDLSRIGELELDASGMVDAARSVAEQVSGWLDGEWQRRAEGVTRELRHWFADRGVTLQGEGMELVGDPFTLSIRPADDRACLLFAGEVVKDRLPLAPARIYDAWERERARMERDATGPERFADLLITATDDSCRLRQVPIGARQRLPDVHFQLFARRQTAQVRQDPRKGRVKEYPRYLFAWDLGELLAAPAWLQRQGRRLTVHAASESAARSRSSSVLVRRGGDFVALGDVQASE